MVDEDGDLLASFRHLDAVLKISRATGAIRWILGGRCDQFGLTAEQRFSHQHHPRRTADGRLSLFDNGNATGLSRALLLNLDEAGRKLRTDEPTRPGFVAFPGPRRGSFAMGSVQLIDGGPVLVGWGAHLDGLADVSEIDPVTGVPGFELAFQPTALGGLVFSYRAQKFH
jgi:hypothetical protein